MGWWPFRRVGSDPYYSNYEKSFEKIEKKCEALQERKSKRRKRFHTYQGSLLWMLWASIAAAMAHVAWLKQLPSGSYSIQQHMLRVGVSCAVPAVFYILHAVVKRLLVTLEARDDKETTRLNESKKKMIKDLKDSTRFEKTMALIKKYDPDAQPAPTPLPPTTAGAKGKAGMPPGTGGPLTGGARLTPGSQLLARTGGMAAAAAAGAGKALFPVFDTLANSVIGDNPMLVDELKRAQEDACKLARENAALRAQLAKLMDLPDASSLEFDAATNSMVAGKPKPGQGSKDSGGGDLGSSEDQRSKGMVTPVPMKHMSGELPLTPPEEDLR